MRIIWIFASAIRAGITSLWRIAYTNRMTLIYVRFILYSSGSTYVVYIDACAGYPPRARAREKSEISNCTSLVASTM